MSNIMIKIRQKDKVYGFDGGLVLDILKLPTLTRVPRQPDFLRGIFSYKGTILPVLSMGALGGAEEAGQEAMCVIFQIDGKRYALSVEEVSEMESDGGHELEMSSTGTKETLLSVVRVLVGEPPVFVLDMTGMIARLEEESKHGI